MEVIQCNGCSRKISISHYNVKNRERVLEQPFCSICRGKQIIRRFRGLPVAETVTANKTSEETVQSEDSLEKTLADLNSLIGMDNVKADVNNMISYLEIMREREALGIANEQVSLHIVFRGPPGTGKTTVARILARVYKHLGYLKSGHLEETDRSGLVGEYVGHTAVKTNKIIDKALDGVLFIDEAYALSPEGSGNDFGQEAIATLVKRMEDERKRLAVIVAGYSDDMERFLTHNVGLRSRFNTYFDFWHYNPEELYQMFASQAKKNVYIINPETEECVRSLLTQLYENRNETTFGNGRLVRNIMEMSIRRHAARVAKLSKRSRETLTELHPEDIPSYEEVTRNEGKKKEEA